jgi:hypothetical protein
MARAATLSTAIAALGVALPALAARADEPPAPAPSAACAAWDVEYALAANVQLSDTTFGAGDGVHKIGPGRLVLRVEGATADRLAGHVRMLFYDMKDGFTVVAKALFWGTTVKNDTHTTATPDARGTIAEGTLGDRSLTWTTPINGMRTDGALFCEGSLCGKFGAPPGGASEVHTTPHPVTFSPFLFDAEHRTFTMAYSVVSRSESPSQTSRITLAGREAKRTCVP